MTRYEVEWCIEFVTDETGDTDYDRCKYATKTFETLSEARRYAQKVVAGDNSPGLVQIREQHSRAENYHGHIVIEWDNPDGVLEEVVA